MSVEKPGKVLSGVLMVPVVGVLIVGGLAATIAAAVDLESGGDSWPVLWISLAAQLVGWLLAPGFFSLQPNESRVLVLFGNYSGTVRTAGFHWGNPFYSNASVDPRRAADQKLESPTKRVGLTRFRVSLRARTMAGEVLKVNDRRGNPVEIGAMVVWRVTDTAKAVFDVDDFALYVRTQAETALRHVATAYPYDQGNDEAEDTVTLRGNPDEVAGALRQDLERRLAVAGVTVEDTRLTHLAYAAEIAQAMLRRQQAEAVIAARRKIVHGAVSMVSMALEELSSMDGVTMSDDARAAMVGNLMVVLSGESDVQPVVSTGM